MVSINTGGPTNASENQYGNRVYTWRGVKYPSVTSIPRMAGLRDPLYRFFISNLIGYVIDNASDINLRTATGDEREIKTLRSRLWKAVDGDDKKRLIGIAVHRAAALGQRPEDVHPDTAPKLYQYLNWLKRSGVEILGSEFQVFNLTEGYAGTVDLLVRWPDGRIEIIDLKTGKGLYGEHALQLIAYLMAEFSGANDVVDERMTALLRQVSGVGILHLGDEGWELVSLEVKPDAWTAYRGLIRYVAWMQANTTLDHLAVTRTWSDGRTTSLSEAALREAARQVTP